MVTAPPGKRLTTAMIERKHEAVGGSTSLAFLQEDWPAPAGFSFSGLPLLPRFARMGMPQRTAERGRKTLSARVDFS